MGWTLDHTSRNYTMDCSLGYNEFLGAIHGQVPWVSPSKLREDKIKEGLTKEKFNELKGIQGNCSNLVQCSDPNSEFNDGNESCIGVSDYVPFETDKLTCYCVCKSGYEADSKGVCVESSSLNSKTNNFWTPKKVIVGVGIGIGVMVMFSLMSGGEKDVLEESV